MVHSLKKKLFYGTLVLALLLYKKIILALLYDKFRELIGTSPGFFAEVTCFYIK